MKFHYGDAVKVVGEGFYRGARGLTVDCGYFASGPSYKYQVELLRDKTLRWFNEDELEAVQREDFAVGGSENEK